MFIHPQIARDLEEFAEHTLTCLTDANGVSVYEAKKPGTMINSFTVAFLPNHICITGDYSPWSCYWALLGTKQPTSLKTA